MEPGSSGLGFGNACRSLHWPSRNHDSQVTSLQMDVYGFWMIPGLPFRQNPINDHIGSYRIRIYGIVVLGSQRHGVLRVLQDMWVRQRMHLVVSHVP